MTDLAKRPTIRMRKCSDRTLNGYVFKDEEHARKWLSSRLVTQDEIRLERVLVGKAQACRCCGGRGFRTPLTIVEKGLSVSAFLGSPA